MSRGVYGNVVVETSGLLAFNFLYRFCVCPFPGVRNDGRQRLHDRGGLERPGGGVSGPLRGGNREKGDGQDRPRTESGDRQGRIVDGQDRPRTESGDRQGRTVPEQKAEIAKVYWWGSAGQARPLDSLCYSGYGRLGYSSPATNFENLPQQCRIMKGYDNKYNPTVKKYCCCAKAQCWTRRRELSSGDFPESSITSAVVSNIFMSPRELWTLEDCQERQQAHGQPSSASLKSANPTWNGGGTNGREGGEDRNHACIPSKGLETAADSPTSV